MIRPFGFGNWLTVVSIREALIQYFPCISIDVNVFYLRKSQVSRVQVLAAIQVLRSMEDKAEAEQKIALVKYYSSKNIVVLKKLKTAQVGELVIWQNDLYETK